MIFGGNFEVNKKKIENFLGLYVDKEILGYYEKVGCGKGAKFEGDNFLDVAGLVAKTRVWKDHL